MHKNLRWRLFLIVMVVGGAGLSYHYMGVNLGLDLRGGAEILYKVHLKEAEPGTVNVVTRAMDVINRRIAPFGGEHRIERLGEDQILIQLPDKGEREIDRIKKLIKTTGKLTFHLVASEENIKKHVENNTTPPGYLWKNVESTNEKLLIKEKPDFSGDAITNAQVGIDQDGVHSTVRIDLKSASRSKFARLTRDHIGARLAIVMDGVETGTVYSAPTIQDEIVGGQPIITGNFNYEEAEKLVLALLSGQLPAPISVEYENIVGPSLGHDSIQDGKKAIIIGLALVFAFMAMYYLVAGLIANVAIVCNLVILLGILAYLDATLTLPGLAGIVLLIGMSVDANVLIFERIREEIAQKRTLSLAVRNGYRRVFVTIMDANLTTLFTAIILFWAGTGPVKGFAVTLGIGLLASMFTSLFVTRTIFDFLIAKKIMSSFKVFSLIGKTSFDFSKYWKMTAVVSTVTILLGLALYFQRGREMYDIDFLGGGLIHVRFAEKQDIENVRRNIRDLGTHFSSCQIQSVWSPHERMADLDFGKSKEFELRFELPENKSEQETFMDNAKARLRERFARILAADAIDMEFGAITSVHEPPYTGGTAVSMKFKDSISVETLEKRLRGVIQDAEVRGRDEDEGKNMCRLTILTTAIPDSERVKAIIDRELSSEPFPRTRKIGADIARKMIEKAIKAMVLAMIGIVIYMTFRFQLGFGIGAVVALVHDVLFTMGALAVARVEVNLPIIAAFLTIIGYSLNDTIVLFDRIRENMNTMKDTPFIQIVKLSINQTIGRTLITSLTTLFAAGALFVWGGGVIHNFAYALIVGVVVGTYSSIFIAAPIVVLWQGKNPQ